MIVEQQKLKNMVIVLKKVLLRVAKKFSLSWLRYILIKI